MGETVWLSDYQGMELHPDGTVQWHYRGDPRYLEVLKRDIDAGRRVSLDRSVVTTVIEGAYAQGRASALPLPKSPEDWIRWAWSGLVIAVAIFAFVKFIAWRW